MSIEYLPRVNTSGHEFQAGHPESGCSCERERVALVESHPAVGFYRRPQSSQRSANPPFSL
jgi:hypothetical protein